MDLQASSDFRRAVSDGDAVWAHRSPKRFGTLNVEPLFSEGTFEGKSITNRFAHVKQKLNFKRLTESGDGEKSTISEESPSSPTSAGIPKLSVFLGSRCTRVHFVRHAEGFHNVITRQAAAAAEAVTQKAFDDAMQAALKGGKTQSEAQALAAKAKVASCRLEENRPVHFATAGAATYTDAELTEAGRNQCYALRGKMDRNRLVDPLQRTHIDLVVVSPLRRCLETADIIFGPCRADGRSDLKPFLVHDLCRERFGEFYCDKRLPMSETMRDPRWSRMDWQTQTEDWPASVMPFSDEDTAWSEERETEEHVHDRAIRFLQWLSSRPEQELAVVTHSSFLKNLFKVFGGDTSTQDQDVLRAVPANCELRTVVLCHHG